MLLSGVNSDIRPVPWRSAREDRMRAATRAHVRRARARGNPLAVLVLLAGPGILVMLGENDGPSMIAYAATSATYGLGFFVPFIILTFALAYVVQEMAVRIGIATQRGHAELIYQRFGPIWGALALGDLVVGNLLTLVTEFVAVRAGGAYFGIPPEFAVAGAALLVAVTFAGRRYITWERGVLALAAGNLFFVPAALLAHPDWAALGRAALTWSPLPGSWSPTFLTLLLATIGATVTPWMLFFQQSAVADKGLTVADLGQSRLDTALGGTIAAVVAIATLVACAPLYAHHLDAANFAGAADFATALRPYIGTAGAALFALGMIEAGLVAAMTISTSSAYAVGEVLRSEHSLNLSFAEAPQFYLTAIGVVALAAGITLIPHAPLLAIALDVNVIATLLMAPALLLLLLLANDREIMGGLANTVRQNIVAGSVSIAIAAVGAAYAAVLVYRLIVHE